MICLQSFLPINYFSMTKAKEISLFITLLVWATLIGAVAYSHIVFFSTYLHHLPDSTRLISGADGLKDENFWMLIHPLSIITLLTTLTLNWKLPSRRKYILLTFSIYIVVLGVTFTYFVPELKAFAQSNQSGISATEWLERGKRWERLSWIRGFFMYAGFIILLTALIKNRNPK
jgi:Domain of unknown function (DUF1772)